MSALRDRLVEVVTEAVGPGGTPADAAALLGATEDRAHRGVGDWAGCRAGRGARSRPSAGWCWKANHPRCLDADGLFAFAGEPEALQRRDGYDPHATHG